MSASGLYYQLVKSFGSNERLAFYHDFKDYAGPDIHNSYFTSGSSPYTGYIRNEYPAYNTGKYNALLFNATGTLLSTVTGFTANTINSGLNLTRSNIRIPIHELNLDDFGMIIDFEFSGPIKDGVIFGSFEKSVETVNGIDYTGSNGFNVGVTKRGHLFLQTYGQNGDQINVLHTSELSKRNIIGISSFGNSIVLSKIDYLNDEIESIDILTESNYLTNSDYIYFGGSKQYYSSVNEKDLTFSGSINQLAIVSGAVSEDYLKYLGSGMIGDYYLTNYSPVAYTRVTGYSESIVYKTGITGYDYSVNGTLTIATGREYITGYSSNSSTQSKKEGERYYKYYTLDNGGQKTYYKEELGFLHPNSGYVYYPTGYDAFDTLGLREVSGSIITYIVSEVTGQPSTTINLYDKTARTGTLREISGVVQTALTETYYETPNSISGLVFSGDSSLLKKDYIYYLGERL